MVHLIQLLSLCVFTVFGYFDSIICVKHEMETKLHEDLLEKYDSNVAPLIYDELLPVNLSFTLLRIRNFDEVEEVLQTNGLFNIQWTDIRLTWNETEFGNLSGTILKQEKLWVPDITNTNSVKEFKSLGDPNMSLKLSSSGRVSWEPIVTLDTACDIDTRYFPFDKQTCKIVVMPWHANAETFVLYGDAFSLRPVTQNGHWEVVASKIKTVVRSKVHLQFFVDLKRRPQYYTTTLLLPVLAVSLLTCFSFLLPRHSGEKISYSITVFLSYMVLMTFITNSLPKTSTEQPILVEYIGAMIVFALVSVIWSVLTSFFAECCACSGDRNTVHPNEENERVLGTTDDVKQSPGKLQESIAVNVKTAILPRRLLHTTMYENEIRCDKNKNEPDNHKTFCAAERFSLGSRIGADETKQCTTCTMMRSTKQYLKYLDFAMFLISTLVTVVLTYTTLSTLSEKD